MIQTNNLEILIAEDDALLNEGIASQVARLGYTSAGQAYDGPQAVELACQRHPAVILMDLQMIDPETGREDMLAGLKATQIIQERSPAAVVVLTAHQSPDLVRRASEAGVSGYLVKPAADPELDRAITIARARFSDLLKLRWATHDLDQRNQAMQEALAQSMRLSGLLSVCAWCKRVRDDVGDWQQIEVFVEQRSEAKFSHGVCPECHRNMFPGNHPSGQA
jgi:DNA-binding NarL/FixJ family response regulator